MWRWDWTGYDFGLDLPAPANARMNTDHVPLETFLFSVFPVLINSISNWLLLLWIFWGHLLVVFVSSTSPTPSPEVPGPFSTDHTFHGEPDPWSSWNGSILDLALSSPPGPNQSVHSILWAQWWTEHVSCKCWDPDTLYFPLGMNEKACNLSSCLRTMRGVSLRLFWHGGRQGREQKATGFLVIS